MAMATNQKVFLGHAFDVQTKDAWRDLVCGSHTEQFDYVVTPNVDHIVQLSRRPEIKTAYDLAKWCMCDSKIIGSLARRRGLDLQVYPGADLVRDLLDQPAIAQRKIAIIGPSKSDFDALCARLPALSFAFVDAPMMTPSSESWTQTLEATEATQADIFMLCLSFPKQEFFAQALKERGIARGIGLCVGASVDFITGRQTRAPKWVRQIGAEWAYRLLSNPKRMWKRYVIDGPKIFMLFLRDRNS
jgi:exopolysaccharide biosynthesis WecB/TagA/CpsF family protein